MNLYVKSVRILFFGFWLTALAASNAFAADLIEPQKIIEDSSNQIRVRMQDPEFNKDFLRVTEFVRTVINPHADFDLISSLVLGKFWKDATPVEKDNFKREFQTLLIRTYSRAFVEFKDWTIKFLPVDADGDQRKILVKTQILQPGLQPVEVNYRMLFNNGEWKVYDILIEGVSLVTNYRTSFKNDVERTGSLQEVIKQLVTRNAEALAGKKRS